MIACFLQSLHNEISVTDILFPDSSTYMLSDFKYFGVLQIYTHRLYYVITVRKSMIVSYNDELLMFCGDMHFH